jgi:hypothetical protein
MCKTLIDSVMTQSVGQSEDILPIQSIQDLLVSTDYGSHSVF